MLVFRADDFARWILLVRGQDFVLPIILADDVEHVCQSVIVVVAGVRAEQRLRHRPGRVGFVGNCHQSPENALCQFRLRRVVNFVAHAVKDDAGMIAVAQNGVAFVRFRPFVEIQMIVVGILGHSPAIEHFVHHQKSHAVAQIEKLRRGRVVRGANGIHSERLQGFQPFFPDTQRHRRAERAAIVMQANALDLEILSVQPEAGVRLEMRVADAEGRRRFVQHRAGRNDFADGVVKLRIVKVPELRF